MYLLRERNLSHGSGRRIAQISRMSLRAAVCALLYFALHISLPAQTVNATLRGTVTDASGGTVADAQLSLLEPATGQLVRRAASMQNGDFEFNEIKPGTYELRCTSAGFKMFVATNILLESGQVRRVDTPLALGAVADEVTVSAGAAVIATESATLSGTFSAKQHDESPQVTVYPTTYSMLTTLSGVQGGKGVPTANGETPSQQMQTFDGIPNDLAGEQSNNANFFEEVSATLFNAPAESPVPVQIGSITKRGTNSIHGRASYRIYDSVFNAMGYFDTSKNPFLQHEWDLEAGGPIWRDRTFFYGEWFAQRIPLGTQNRANVPTNNWRNGVFSTPIIDPLTHAPFPNNTIPANRMSSVALAFQNNYLPAPNISTTDPFNNYAFHFPFNNDLYRGDWPLGRVDHNLTKQNSLFVRWSMRQTPYVLNNGLPSLVWTRLRRHQQWVAGDTHIFTPQLLNNFRFGYSTDYIVDGQTEAGQTPPDGSKVLAQTGLQGSNPSGLTGQGFPTITISGLASLSNVSGGVKNDNHIGNFNDSVVWQHGRHVWKFGGSVQRFRNFRGVVPDYGTFNFNGFVTGSAYADFLLGLPQQSQRSNPLGAREQKLTEYGIYAEDSFKVTRRLNIDYGVRWDIYGTPNAGDHLMYNWDPSTGNVIVDPAALSKVSPLYPVAGSQYCQIPNCITVTAGDVRATADKSNITPRIGAAYQLSDHSVLRGGYGIYTSRFNNGGNLQNFLPINPQLGSTGPFSISETYLTDKTSQLLSFPNPYPSSTATATVPSQSVTGYPRQVSHGRIHQFSATYELEVRKIGLRASYVGSRSTGLNYSVNTNLPAPSAIPFTSSRRPQPQFVKTTLIRYDGGAKYDSLQLEAKRRIAGLTFDGSYALSRSKANYLDTENPYNVLSHWANDGITQRHYVSGSVAWSLPFGKGHRYIANSGELVERAVGGWSTNVITYLGSGTWFSPSFNSSDPSNTGTVGGLPDLVGDPNKIQGGRGKTNWFNVAAFAVPQAGHFGNALPNSLESQHLYLTHISVIKVVPLTERIKFNFVTQIS